MDMPVGNARSLNFNLRAPGLPVRLALLAALFFLEKFLLNFLVDFDAAQSAQGLGAFIRVAQHDVLRFLVSLGITLAVFAYVRPVKAADSTSKPVEATLQVRWLAAHALLFLPLAPLSYALYRGSELHLPFALVATLWLTFASLAVAAAFRGMAPWSEWLRAARSLGELWIYALVAAVAATAAMHWVQGLWKPSARLTFHLVNQVLLPFIPGLQSDPVDLILDTGRFAVRIADQCSGLEGLGLMLIFSSAWLLLFRREYRFPRALLLVPIGLLLVFALNVVRIAALVLIGHGGHPGIAIYGFHSQAGWIAFNCAAGAVVLLSRRISWLNRVDAIDAQNHESSNPTAAYLMPFLIILVAGTVAHALSSGFEMLYPMRLIAGLAALIWYRKRLADLNFRCTWRGPAAGIVVFALWMAAARFLLEPASEPKALADMSAPLRDAWIACRAGAAIITVPIIEELAYRGFLLRRWLGAEFESIPFSAVRLPQLLLTSLLFGVVHGSMWLPGTVAGLAYGALVMRTGRIGESIAAHATTNALIAVCVVFGNQWQLW